MINYDSFSLCHFADIFFRHASGGKRMDDQKYWSSFHRYFSSKLDRTVSVDNRKLVLNEDVEILNFGRLRIAAELF